MSTRWLKKNFRARISYRAPLLCSDQWKVQQDLQRPMTSRNGKNAALNSAAAEKIEKSLKLNFSKIACLRLNAPLTQVSLIGKILELLSVNVAVVSSSAQSLRLCCCLVRHSLLSMLSINKASSVLMPYSAVLLWKI